VCESFAVGEEEDTVTVRRRRIWRRKIGEESRSVKEEDAVK
jgi:hypothetical protein